MKKDTPVAAALAAAALALTAILATEARASDTYLIVHGASRHGASAQTFNEVNAGAAIRVDLTDTHGVQAGVYRNSYYKTTVYAGYQYTPVRVGVVRLGGFAGFASGYAQHTSLNVGSLSLMAGAYAVADIGRITVALRAVPKVSPKTASVVAVEVGFKF
jgi:hypothetical protein